MQLKKPNRQFLPEDFSVNTWETLEGFFVDLLDREIEINEDLDKWMRDRSELESLLEEDFAWRYIRMQCDTENEKLRENFLDFVENIQPKVAPMGDKLNRKLVAILAGGLGLGPAYDVFLKGVRSSIEIFREKNVPIFTDLEAKAQEYGALTGKMSVEDEEGNEVTLQAAGKKLEDADEKIREEFYRKIWGRRLEDSEKLQDLLSELIKKRNEVARNAGFENFRDYKMVSMGRFDYGVKECEDFWESVRKEVVPVVKKWQEERAQKLGKEKLRPWDLSVDPEGLDPLRPFEKSVDMLKKVVMGFDDLGGDLMVSTEIGELSFGDCLKVMDSMGHFDLDSRKGKAPGGFNYPLYEIGVPFIYMNSVGTQRDLETMVHEGGHALHSFFSRDLPISDLKSTPSEVAELASQAMELFSMNFWDKFYDADDLVRAKREKLKDCVSMLPWVAMVDEFQHWLYTHEGHSGEERNQAWLDISRKYDTGMVDYEGIEDFRKIRWQGQLHIYEVPFYYIEYGISQLGALAMWKNFRENKEQTMGEYVNFMKLGYTKSMSEIYDAAGIRFDFSRDYVRELVRFVEGEVK